MKNEFTVEKLLLINKELEDENEILKLSIKDLKYNIEMKNKKIILLEESSEMYKNMLLKNRIRNIARKVKNKIRRK